ncbi:RND family transporter [Myxococcota bacterium]
MDRAHRRISQWVELRLGWVAATAASHPYCTLGLVGVATIMATFATARTQIETDLIDLLPESFESVQTLERVRENFGAFGFVTVVGTGAEPEILKQFADDAAARLSATDGVRYVDYRRARDFFLEHALFFLAKEDLETLETRLTERLEWERRKRNPLLLDIEETEPPSLDFAHLQEKYLGGQSGTGTQFSKEVYYLDPEKRMIVLFVKPDGVESDLTYAREMVDRVQGTIADIDLGAYSPDLRVVYGGAFTKRVEQHKLIAEDLTIATWVSLILVILYVTWHFRRAAAAAFLLIPLVVTLIWTYAFAAASFESLNILTAFLGAILLGLGIDHGIHLLARFYNEWPRQRSFDAVIRHTYGETIRTVTVAAATTAVGFLGLSLSEFRAFSEMGVIAAAGMVFIIVAYLTVLPALLAVAINLGWRPRPRSHVSASLVGGLISRRAGLVCAGLVVLLMLGFVGMQHTRFNTNLRALAQSELLSFRLDYEVDRILGYARSPVVLFAEDDAHERAIAAAVRRRKAEGGSDSPIRFVMARSDLVPERQEEKIPAIRRIGTVLTKVRPRWLPREHRRGFALVKRMTAASSFTQQDLPREISQLFEAPGGGEQDSFVLVFANVDVSDASQAIGFAREMRNLDLGEEHQQLSAAGEAMVMADAFEMIADEAPVVLTLTFLLVFATMWLLMGSLTDAIFAFMPAGITGIGTLGLLPVIGLELNTLNVVIVPILVGISVDGGVHMVTRHRHGYGKSSTLDYVGGAIAAALLTTSLGFGSLLLANHSGLRSLGMLAVLGLAVNLLACLVGLPAVLAVTKARFALPSLAGHLKRITHRHLRHTSHTG